MSFIISYQISQERATFHANESRLIIILDDIADEIKYIITKIPSSSSKYNYASILLMLENYGTTNGYKNQYVDLGYKTSNLVPIERLDELIKKMKYILHIISETTYSRNYSGLNSLLPS